LTSGRFDVLVSFVSISADIAETRARMLGELAELGLVLARDLQQAALVAEHPQDKVRLAEAFARVGRGVRQSLALHARMEREAMRDAGEAEAEAASLEPVRRKRRKAEVRSAIETIIWREHERLDADPDILLEELDAYLDDEARTEGFLHSAAETLVARLCRTLGLPIPPAGDSAGAADTATRTATPSPEESRDPPQPPARPAHPGGLSRGGVDGEWRSSA
jgi:hypothetical protein